MINKWQVEVTTSKGEVFLIEYRSWMDSKDNGGLSAGVEIKSVEFKGYILALAQLRERLVWTELESAVRHAANDMWHNYWKGKDAENENVVLQRQDFMDNHILIN